MVAVPKGSSSLQLALNDTGATVTAILERIVGEPVDAGSTSHTMTSAGSANLLGVEAACPLLLRTAVLKGRRSARPYLYAESLLVPSRLPASFCQELQTSRDPIGRLLVNSKIAFTRSQLPQSEGSGAFSDGLSVPDEYLLSRRYRVESDGVPVMVVAEWFLPALELFVGRE